MKPSRQRPKRATSKKIIALVFSIALITCSVYSQGARYIDEVFTEVVKISNQRYSVNSRPVTDIPLDTLLFDLYLPAGDTCRLRPLVILLHTGTFLPGGLIAPTGSKDDYANVRISEALAKRGYVTASIQYSVGWNPNGTEIVRRSTYINALYRSIQDLYTFIRFMNMTVLDSNNLFRIDTSRVAVFGMGTGAIVALNAAVLQQDEIYIDKFMNPVTGLPFIDTLLVGDLHRVKQALYNIPNHVGYNDSFHFTFGLDGAIGDSSWLEDGTSVPLVAGGNVNHPKTPYGINFFGEIECYQPHFFNSIMNFIGSACVINKANSIGINDPLNKVNYNDPVSEALRKDENSFNLEHLWPINQEGAQTGPWEYWDSIFWDMVPHPGGGSIDDNAKLTNPDMSLGKANRYIDTALWFFSPRAFTVLKLNELVCSCEEVVPNPTFFLINDFECHRNFEFGAGLHRIMIMDNPDKEGDFNGEKIGSYLDDAHDPWAAICVLMPENVPLSKYDTFMIDVNSPLPGVPFLFKLEGGSSPPFDVWDTTTYAGTWETLEADFSSQASANYTRICIFPNAGADVPTETNYLLDNLRLNGQRIVGIFNPTIETLVFTPNPVNDILFIRNPGDAASFRIINTLGQQVIHEKTNDQQVVAINMSDVLPGIYFIGAYNRDGRLIGNARVMKN